MFDSYPSAQRTALLYFLGFIYGISLATILMWTAGFVLIFCASAQAQLNSSRHRVDKHSRKYPERLKRAFYWQSEFDPTPRTLRVAESMMFVYCFAFFAIALMSPYSLAEMSDGWVFVEHTIAIGISLLATSAVVVVWFRRLPMGQTWPQACYRCFSPINPMS